MNVFLLLTAVVLGIIMLVGFLNEKVFHLTYEIVLLLASIFVGVCMLAAASLLKNTGIGEILEKIQLFDLEAFLLDGEACWPSSAQLPARCCTDFCFMGSPGCSGCPSASLYA